MIKKFSNIEGKKSGIYKITHIPSKKIYIGSSKCFNIRYKAHIRNFIKNKNSFYMQQYYNKSEPNDFIMEIIEFTNIEDLLKNEQKYINLHYDNQKQCFNLCPTAGSWLNKKHTEESKKKISRDKIKKFTLVSPDNKIITEFGLKTFCIKYNLNIKGLNKIVYQKRKSYKGWRTLENINYTYKDFIKVFNLKNNKKRSKFYNIKLKSPDGKIYGPIKNIRNFSLENNLIPSNMYRLINKKIKTHRKWSLIK